MPFHVVPGARCAGLLLSCALPFAAVAAGTSPPVAEAAPPLAIAAGQAPAQPYDAGLLRLVVPSADTGGRFAVIELTEQPPYRTPAHRHPDMDESFYVLEGTLALEMGGRAYRLPAGSFVHIPRGTVHAQGSADDRPVRLLTTLSPGGFEQFFLDRVELAKTVRRDDPEFQARMLEIVGRYPQWLRPPPEE